MKRNKRTEKKGEEKRILKNQKNKRKHRKRKTKENKNKNKEKL